MTLCVAVFGKKGRGKTKTIETLVAALRRAGKRVAVAKHVHHADFTIDREGKDSWRYTAAGAERVIIISPRETVTIDKVDAPSSADDAFRVISEGDYEFMFLEGFYHLFSKDDRVKKLVVGFTDEDIADLIADMKGPALGIVLASEEGSLRRDYGMPVYRLSVDKEKLVQALLAIA